MFPSHDRGGMCLMNSWYSPSFPRFRCKPGFFGRSTSCSLSQHSQRFHFITMRYHTMDKHSCLVPPYTFANIFYTDRVASLSKMMSFFLPPGSPFFSLQALASSTQFYPPVLSGWTNPGWTFCAIHSTSLRCHLSTKVCSNSVSTWRGFQVHFPFFLYRQYNFAMIYPVYMYT